MGVPKGKYGFKLSRMVIPEREPAGAVVADGLEPEGVPAAAAPPRYQTAREGRRSPGTRRDFFLHQRRWLPTP